MRSSLHKYRKFDNVPPSVEKVFLPPQATSSILRLQDPLDPNIGKLPYNSISISLIQGRRPGEDRRRFQRDIKLQLFIKSHNMETFSFTTGLSSTIQDIKANILSLKGISIDEQTLIFAGKQLENHRTLSDYNIQDEVTLHLILRQAGGCFVSQAPIILSNGSSRTIKDIKIGDEVLTYNTSKQRLEANMIKGKTVSQADSICEITVGNQKILCTSNHPFWTRSSAWKAVKPHPDSDTKLLGNEDLLLDYNLRGIKVDSFKTIKLQEPIEVHNLHVESNHNYFAYGFLAHNVQICVKIPSGDIVVIDAEPKLTVAQIKEKLAEKTGITVQKQSLVCEGVLLHDSEEIELNTQTILHLYYISNDVTLNVIYHQITHILSVPTELSVKELKEVITSMCEIVSEEVTLLFGGRVLLNDESKLDECGLCKNSDILVIPSEDGGSSLRFMQLIQDTPLGDLKSLRQSLDFLKNEDVLNEFFTDAQNSLKEKQLKQGKYNMDQLLALMLYNSDIITEQLNKALTEGTNLKQFNIFLKLLISGLQATSYHKGTVYFGIKDYQNSEAYKEGSTISWKTVTQLSKSKQAAEDASNNEGTVFEVQVIASKDISWIEKDKVILMPFTCLEVVSVTKNPSGRMYIKLREIPVPRGPKVLFWVDDNPENNFTEAVKLESQGISCVFCTSTQDALNVIDTYRWLLYLQRADFRIVTDMVRLEREEMNYVAGIELMQILFEDYRYGFEVLVYCNDVTKAENNCDNAKLKGPYVITSNQGKLLQFLNFESQRIGIV